MKIIIDTREQIPLEFNHPYITEIIREKLDVGDYGVRFEDRHQPKFVFERKGGLGDLFQTFGKGYPRFKRKLLRASEAGITVFIAIEGTISKILKGYEHSTIQGISVFRHLLTLYFRHHVPFHFFKSREEMSIFMVETFLTLGKEYIRKK